MIKLALFLVLISLSSAAFALTEGEIAALQSIHNGWPRLANKSPPWTSNISAACAGEGFYGLRCSEDHEHVIEMYDSAFRQRSQNLPLEVFYSIQTAFY